MLEVKELLDQLEQINDKLLLAKEKVDLKLIEQELVELNKQIAQPDFWDNPDVASVISQKVSFYQTTLETWKTVFRKLQNTKEMLSEISADEYEVMYEDFVKVLFDAKNLYLQTLLDGKFDKNSAILSVICGTGGKDAQDFTEILARMYGRYAEKRGFKVEILDETRSDEVGLKNISFLIEGINAYGYLKNEHGVHRLVRQSPFNSGNTRETSFAMVDVIPKIEMTEQVEINEEDLRIDVFRASGAGGQHVNTTDSAVRITHLPTGIVVSVQSDRSQHKNKDRAMQILQGRLQQLLVEQNALSVDELRGVKKEMSWGNQIRSYVLHPYKMVKDHRTGYEVNDCEAVFDGEIQDFIETKLVG
jgi:peptide chain release factor 2